MQADTIISRDGPVAAPLDYVIPGATELVPKLVSATFDGASAAGSFLPALEIITPSGIVLGPFVICSAIAAGGSATVSWFPGGCVGCCPAAPIVPGVGLETLLLDSRTAGVTSSTVLTAGKQYLVTVQGTYSLWNTALEDGTPEADAMFPTSGGVARVSTEVGLDPDVKFAAHLQPGSYPQHTVELQFDLGSGYSHLEPDGGPYAAPKTGHLYSYTLTGEGSALSVRVFDSPQSDNYGYLRVVIQDPAASGGSGTLVPVGGSADSLLQMQSGAPAWTTTLDGGSA